MGGIFGESDMNPMEKSGWTPLPHSDEDLERAKSAPDTPQTRAATYRLAWNDEEFMTRRELRPVLGQMRHEVQRRRRGELGRDLAAQELAQVVGPAHADRRREHVGVPAQRRERVEGAEVGEAALEGREVLEEPVRLRGVEDGLHEARDRLVVADVRVHPGLRRLSVQPG